MKELERECFERKCDELIAQIEILQGKVDDFKIENKKLQEKVNELDGIIADVHYIIRSRLYKLSKTLY